MRLWRAGEVKDPSCPMEVFKALLETHLEQADGLGDPGRAEERKLWEERWNVAVEAYELELRHALDGLPPPRGYREDH